MSEVQREDRYIVIKRTDMEKADRGIRQGFQRNSRWLHDSMLKNGAPARSFIVIESDWPEYEIAWKMIEDRIVGKPNELTAAQSELAALREGLESCRESHEAMRADLIATEQRLAGAERRYRGLQKLTPYKFRKIQDASTTDGIDVLYFHADRFDALLDAALTKPEEAKS